ncbi:MAG: Crp/Fnr family transcriptional regulator [Actinomycetota bacterium]|nr:Crp/Fnr family transcriptional regulator [Actinomycetota bacterium]
MIGADGLSRNAILAGLPADELAKLSQNLEVVDAEVRRQVYQPGEPIAEVYFPLASVFSVVGMAGDRVAVEVATIGREGMVGLPVFLGAASTPHAAFCQVAGPAAKITADSLRQVLADDGALHQALNRFTQATMVQIAQNVVCNSTHATAQRAARWLLTTRDRAGREEFLLTQEFLSQMLGVRRPTASDVARQFQAEGLIRYRRGLVTITDGPGLEQVACFCYAVVKAEFDLITGTG